MPGLPEHAEKANEDILRDRIVVGEHDDDTRHKLLAHEKLTLMDAVQICRSEEAAKHAEMAFHSQLDRLRMRQLKRLSALLTSAKSRLISPSRQPRPRQLRHAVRIVVVDLMRSRRAQQMAGNAMDAKVVGSLRRFARRRRNRRLALTRRLVS